MAPDPPIEAAPAKTGGDGDVPTDARTARQTRCRASAVATGSMVATSGCSRETAVGEGSEGTVLFSPPGHGSARRVFVEEGAFWGEGGSGAGWVEGKDSPLSPVRDEQGSWVGRRGDAFSSGSVAGVIVPSPPPVRWAQGRGSGEGDSALGMGINGKISGRRGRCGGGIAPSLPPVRRAQGCEGRGGTRMSDVGIAIRSSGTKAVEEASG